MRSRASKHLVVVLAAILSAGLTTSARGAGGSVEPLVEELDIDAEAIAIGHITSQPDALGLAAGDVADLVVTDTVVSDGVGVTNVYVQQRHRGIDVFGAVMNIAIDRGQVVSATGEFVPGVAKLAPTTSPELSDVAATAAAARLLGLLPPRSVAREQQAVGAERAAELSDGGISLENIATRLVLQPVEGDVRLAWEVTIYELDAENWWQVRVDAATGRELDRNNLVSADSYNVYALPVEAPSFGGRSTVLSPANVTASPFGWHDTDGSVGPEFTVTEGNNVTSYTDIDGDNIMDPGSQPDGGLSLAFDFPIDLGMDPSTYRDAAVTNLFYWNNVVHDIFYAYGFNEAAGNFQTNTYGNGGAGGDAVRAEVQDGSDVNKANFATPIDGFAPRMQMFVWDSATPDRDSSLDSAIVVHEYGHGISNRLTGGPNTVSCLQVAEQAGEGWSDYFGLMLTMEPGDARTESRGMGTYLLGEPPTGPGIRDFPYNTSMAIDPRTYDTIKTASIPHGVGSVFAAMLWEMTWDLVDRDGFDPDLIGGTGGNITALQMVVDGLKLQPCNPGFVDSRDAILLADQLTNGGANECLIWRAFAKRGLGLSADQGVSASRTDGTEAFDVPTRCEDLALSKIATPTPVTAGRDLIYTIEVTNNTTGPLTGVTITDPIPVGTSYVVGSASCGGTFNGSEVSFPIGVLPALASVTCTLAVVVDAGAGTVTLLEDDFEAGSPQWTLTHGTGTADWATSILDPHSPTTSIFAANVAAASDQYLTTVAQVPISASSVLRFWHQYDTENTWDGGVVEVSTDGVAWTDLGPSFTMNGYDDTLNPSVNPLTGRPAFTGDSAGYVESVADLSSFAGSSVFIRFRFGSDATMADEGWHVDDVLVRDEVWVSNGASAVSNEGPSAVGSTDTLVDPPPGLLRVTTSPAVPSLISVDGQWTDAFGLDWVETQVGAYEVCFSDVPGFTPPACVPAVVSSIATTAIEGAFVTHGTLDITSSPAVATTITIDGSPVNDWGAIVSMEPGTYQVCFGAVTDFDPPPCVSPAVSPGVTTNVVGNFTSNPGAADPSGHGFLRVTTSPALPSQILIDGARAVSFGVDWVKLALGQHEVCFSDVPGFATPPCEVFNITEGVTTVIEGSFDAQAELRVLTSPPGNQPLTVDGRTIDQYGFWTWVPPSVSYDVCAAGFTCQAVSPPPGTLTTVTLVP